MAKTSEMDTMGAIVVSSPASSDAEGETPLAAKRRAIPVARPKAATTCARTFRTLTCGGCCGLVDYLFFLWGHCCQAGVAARDAQPDMFDRFAVYDDADGDGDGDDDDDDELLFSEY